jgi:hypothetical protein
MMKVTPINDQSQVNPYKYEWVLLGPHILPLIIQVNLTFTPRVKSLLFINVC